MWEGFGSGAGGQFNTDIWELDLIGLVMARPFIRGDVNNDGAVDIGDPIYLLNALFVVGSEPPQCNDAADVNDDGGVDTGCSMS